MCKYLYPSNKVNIRKTRTLRICSSNVVQITSLRGGRCSESGHLFFVASNIADQIKGRDLIESQELASIRSVLIEARDNNRSERDVNVRRIENGELELIEFAVILVY